MITVVSNDPVYSPGSVDNVRKYDEQLLLSGCYRPSSIHAVTCTDSSDRVHSCVVLAGGGASGVHDQSLVVVDDCCYLAVGDSLVAFSLPSLGVLWHVKADHATCFGLHYHAAEACLIVHGEMLISRIGLDGTLVWEAGGRDIFTGHCTVGDTTEQVTDFNDDIYTFDLETGRAAR